MVGGTCEYLQPLPPRWHARCTFASSTLRAQLPLIHRANACLQVCAYPRLLLSPKDALYAAKFFIVLHQMNTPYFNTLSYANELAKQVTPTVLCSSRREATCLGVFLLETLTVLRRWYDSKAVYEKEVCGCGVSYLSSWLAVLL